MIGDQKKRAHSRYRLLLLVIVAIGVGGCGDDEQALTPTFADSPKVATAPVYRFGIHPLHNPNRLHEIFGPVMQYLDRHVEGVNFRVEASRNYAAYDEKLFGGAFHFSLPNPYQTVTSLDHGYRVFGKMGDDDNFRGIFLVRKDSGIRTVDDLKGKAVSYPAPTALAATMMPQYYLFQRGIDVMKEVDNRYVGSQESSIMNAFLGHTVAGATWPPPWRALSKERPELAEQLEVKWQTPPLPNNGLVARADMPAELVEQVGRLLFTLHTHEEGRVMLERMELSRFEPADDSTYEPVRAFLKDFQAKIRPPRDEA
jgi:phosphonate transport system substrate-binding protein